MITRLNEGFNAALDRLVHPVIYVRGRSWSAFHVCGYTGLALATWLAMGLALRQHLSFWTMAAIVLAAVLTFFGLALLTKIIRGGESLTYFHHELAILAVAAVLAWLSRQPVLPYLDITILAIGLFLACGRVGCLMVGCCHGRPHRWGVCYRDEHAAAGFASYLVRVRLFPVQALEALWVFFVVLVGTALVLSGRPPGTALAWYAVSYGLGRFWLEFMRGDAARPYYRGFSEPQWTCLLRLLLVVGAEASGLLPWQGWHAGAVVVLAAMLVLVTFWRRRQVVPKHQLLHPHHVKELAEALERASRRASAGVSFAGGVAREDSVRVERTSLGVQVSASRIGGSAGTVTHYALSSQNGMMNQKTASTLAGLILQLRCASVSAEIVKGQQGIYHLLVPT